MNSDRGLLVPVVRDVQAKGLHQVALESDVLIQRARGGTLTSIRDERWNLRHF